MCASYWTIKKAEIKCLNCGETSIWENIQTHFMGGGDGTMCMDYYDFGKKIKALGGVTITLDGTNDDFVGTCPKCGKWADIGAEIKRGKVVKMWVLKNETKN